MARKPSSTTTEPESSAEKTSASMDARENVARTSPPDSAASGEDIALLREELAEVKELARSLMGAVQEARAQAARVDSVRGALEDVKADVRAASHAIIAAPPSIAPPSAARVPFPAVHGGPYENQIERPGCGPCQCVSSGCCAFEIKLWQVRAAKPQIEPGDIGDIPGPTINAFEVQIYVTVDDVGVLIPGLSSWVDLRVEAFPPGPGHWVVFNRLIQTVYVPKGSSTTKVIKAEVLESDERLTEVLQFKAELGEGESTITLDCCVDRIYPPVPLDVDLTKGGKGGGMVQLAFRADRVCC